MVHQGFEGQVSVVILVFVPFIIDMVGLVPLYVRALDVLSHHADVFNHRQPYHNGEGPQLALQQDNLRLVGYQAGFEAGLIQVAVGVRHQVGGDGKDARIALERPCGQHGQAQVAFLCQLTPQRIHLAFNKIEVVQQPLGGQLHGQLLLKVFI